MSGWPVWVFVWLLIMTIAARDASAQLLHGSVSDVETGAPLPGVLITVRDSSQSVRARVVTDQAGGYAITPGSGHYRITAEHIGYASATQAAILGSASVMVRFGLRPAPIALKAVVAHGNARCRTTRDPEAAKVWSVARTALGGAAAETTRWFRIRLFRRYLDLNLQEVEPRRNEFQRYAGRHAFQAISLDSLLQFGFVQDRSGDRYFFGPDAELLLHDDFVNAYCFRVVRDAGRAGLIGLSYWPQQRIKVPGIRGTMWIDEQEGVLRFVEYSYTGIGELHPRYASGRVDFERSPDLTWFVSNWYIRMPRYGQVLTGSRFLFSLIGAEESGGEVLGIDSASQRASTGGVRGVVYDSIARRPLADAEVYLSGTSHKDSTDAHGNFLLSEVTEGEYDISFFHPSMQALPVFENLTRVDVEADSVTAVALAIPSETNLLAVHCAGSELDEAARRLEVPAQRLSVITGIVRSSLSLPNTRVLLKWDTHRLSPHALRQGVVSISAEVAPNGSYRICGAPIDTDLTLEVIVDGRIEYRELMRGSSRRTLRKEITLD